MAENAAKLVRMANQIAEFFRPYGDAEAVAGIHEHIDAFWTRSMKAALLAHAEAGGEGLAPRVVEALEHFRGGRSPIHKATAGPAEAGLAESDAG
ncbi:formate dehydrogenase subunit delta [Propylenella binzhouense]|uniref:Peptidase n=1 Tax=Propylenella binzhouense TaxID=2555902 RepID=A0A964T847_9HYPH|nr:formate dehydrogenase subunit delta [Propylenella binzhouense]MYZ49607.1 peptidase [Propylenella binzhouense]